MATPGLHCEAEHVGLPTCLRIIGGAYQVVRHDVDGKPLGLGGKRTDERRLCSYCAQLYTDPLDANYNRIIETQNAEQAAAERAAGVEPDETTTILNERLHPVAWFGSSAVAESWESTVSEGNHTSKLHRLESGLWVIQKDYKGEPGEVLAFESKPRSSALWLIRHGYMDVAREHFPAEVDATNAGKKATA